MSTYPIREDEPTPRLRLVDPKATYDHDARREAGFVIVPSQVRAIPASVEIGKAGKKKRIPRGAMLGVYVELASYAIDGDVVWPSVKTLAEALGYSEDYIGHVLAALESCGVIVKSHRENHGMKQSNQYGLVYQKCPKDQIPPTAATIPPTAGLDTADSGSGYRPQRQERDKGERDKRERDTPPTPRWSRAEVDEGFDEFWRAYPRKEAKQAARKAWAKLKPDAALVATMLRAIARQRVSAQWQKDGGQFIPHAATWLNQGRWEDELGGPVKEPGIADRLRAYGSAGRRTEAQP